MFDLLRFVCELKFGSSLCLSRESFDYLSSNLNNLITELIQQSFLIALRSKRTRLLGDDLQLVLQCRSITPLYGYCCYSTTKYKLPMFETVRQYGRMLYMQPDVLIALNKNDLTNTISPYHNQYSPSEKFPKKTIVQSNEILIHVEWLVKAGEQICSQIKPLSFNKSPLNIEQQLYLSFLQSKSDDEEIRNHLCHNQIALDTVLPQLIEWCRYNICECLTHSCRLKKRCELASYLTIIDCLLQNPSPTINHYLHILSPIIITCLLSEFEGDELLDYNDENMKTVVDTGHIWSLRLLAAQACVKLLERSTIFVYDVFYTRIISQLVFSLTNSSTSSSAIHAILYLFEQLGCYVSRTFLVPHLLDIDSSKILSSKAILEVLERIAIKITEV